MVGHIFFVGRGRTKEQGTPKVERLITLSVISGFYCKFYNLKSTSYIWNFRSGSSIPQMGYTRVLIRK